MTNVFVFRLVEQVKVYLADTDSEATLNVGADMRKIDQCYRAFKVSQSFADDRHAPSSCSR